MPDLRFLTLDPAHFHAALVQKEATAGVASRAHVYAPLTADLLAHLQRIAGFNARFANPTRWELEVHAGPDYLQRLKQERAGDVVVLAGRNRRKIEYLEAAIHAGLHVLADKPWIIREADFPRLAPLMEEAGRRNLVAYDIMTERHEITSLLQRELIQQPEIFGSAESGTRGEPGVFIESVHFLKKSVAGAPLRRPVSFFDTAEQGEGLTDVGTHLVDLVPWLLWPNQAIDAQRDLEIVESRHWPTLLTLEQYEAITGERVFAPFLEPHLRAGKLEYVCNNYVAYRIRGVHVALNILWDVEAREGGDTHKAVLRGSRSRLEIRQGKEEQWRPELYIVPNRPPETAAVGSALQAWAKQEQSRFAGLSIVDAAGGFRVSIPDRLRVGHEAHFAEVTRDFLQYVRDPAKLPSWETPNLLAKYWLTTRGVAACER
jgi:predicted dehydrogenase